MSFLRNSTACGDPGQYLRYPERFGTYRAREHAQIRGALNFPSLAFNLRSPSSFMHEKNAFRLTIIGFFTPSFFSNRFQTEQEAKLAIDFERRRGTVFGR